MSAQKENTPNKETQMATSQDEPNQGKTPETPQQESSPEEEEEDKKTVRNPRNVVLEPDPLAPFLERLEHDQETQKGFFKGMIEFRQRNKEYPFEREEAMEDFINNWLEVRVPRLDFQQTLKRVWRRYAETGMATGENLNALSPVDRQVFLLQNRILFAYYSEKKDKKRKIQETYGATTSNKGVKIGGSNVPSDKEPLKQYKEVDKNWKIVGETKQKLKQKKPETHGATSNKAVNIGGSNAPPDKEPEKSLKQYKAVDKNEKVVETKQTHKMPEYQEKKVENPRENPEEQKRENPPEEKPSEEDEEEEAWSEANFETLISILQSLGDYNFMLSKYPYDDVNDMEDFIKNWVKLDISVNDCLEVIKRLKKYFKKKFWEAIDHGLRFRNQKQEQLYTNADVLWNMEAHMNSDDEGDEEETKEDSSDEGEGNLKGEHPDDKKRLDFSEPEYDPAMRPLLPYKKRFNFSEPEYDPALRPLLPFLIESTFEQGPGIVPDLMPVDDDAVPLAMLPPPIPPVPRIQDTRKEDKAGRGNESSSVKRIVPKIKVRRGVPPVQGFQDTEKVDKNQQKEKRTVTRIIIIGRGIPRVEGFQDTEKVYKYRQKKVKRTVPQTILRGIPPVPQSQDSKREEMLRRPIPPVPRFQDTKKEDKSQQKADSGEDSGSGNRTDPGGASGQGDDPDFEKHHDENPEGGSEAPEDRSLVEKRLKILRNSDSGSLS